MIFFFRFSLTLRRRHFAAAADSRFAFGFLRHCRYAADFSISPRHATPLRRCLHVNFRFAISFSPLSSLPTFLFFD
jgi:hypothetical protein